MGGKTQQPNVPDPYQTAGAQTSANQQNAAYLAALNRLNTYGPTGSDTYQNQGNDPTTGAPIYSHYTTLSPEQQALYNSNTANQLDQSGFAGNALNQARDSYSPINTNFDQTRQQAQDALYGRNTMYLDKQYDRDQKSLEAKLANEGATEGSEAWKNAMDQFGAQKNQAYEAARDNAISGASAQTGQNISNAISLQNQPLNYYNALMNGSQVSAPQSSNPSQINTNPADIAGAMNNAYQGQLNNYNASVAQGNQTASTAASLIGTILMAL